MAGQYDAQTVISLDFESPTQPDPASPHSTRIAASAAPVDVPQQQTASTASPSRESARTATPTRPPSAAATATAGFTPMRRGQVHGLDDSPRNRQEESARKARATAEMRERGRAVEAMRTGTFKQPQPRKPVAGGDVIKDSGIPVWGGRTTAYSKDRSALPPRDPFEYAKEQCAIMRTAGGSSKNNNERAGHPKPLTMGPRQPSGTWGRQRTRTRSDSPPPAPGPSNIAPGRAPTSARSEPWRPLTQYLPYQLDANGSDDDGEFPRLPSKGKGKERAPPARDDCLQPQDLSLLAREDGDCPNDRDEDELEAMHEAAARRIQEQLWAEERAYNHARRTQSLTEHDDPMDEDEFDDDEEDADVLASDSDQERARDDGYDSFEDMSAVDSPDDDEEPAPLLNIEPALGDDRAKAAARASIFADTKARIRWSPATHEPIAGMTQAKLVAGIDPTQLRQHVKAAASIDHVFIGIVHAIGGTRSSEIDRVTLVTALDTMISLTCRAGTNVLFSAARQDQNGPRLRPGTVLIDTADVELAAVWQESAHWAQAGL